jgi:flagellar hook-length control protein FliK
MQPLIASPTLAGLAKPAPEAPQGGAAQLPETGLQPVDLPDFILILAGELQAPIEVPLAADQTPPDLGLVRADESAEAGEKGGLAPPAGNPLPLLPALPAASVATPSSPSTAAGAPVMAERREANGEAASASRVDPSLLEGSPPESPRIEPAAARHPGPAPTPVEGSQAPPTAPTAAAPDSSPGPASPLPSAPSGETASRPSGPVHPSSHALPLPLDHPDWPHAFAERVAWLSGNGTQVAALRLNPPSLGSIEVRIEVSDQDTVIQFATRTEVAREAVEAALPRLRHLMADIGLDLARVDVSTQLSQRGREEHPGEPQWALVEPDEEGERAGGAEPVRMGARPRASGALIDRYA